MRVISTRKIKKAWQTDAESFEPRCHNLKEKRDSCFVAWDLSKCIIVGLEFYTDYSKKREMGTSPGGELQRAQWKGDERVGVGHFVTDLTQCRALDGIFCGVIKAPGGDEAEGLVGGRRGAT